MGEWPLVVNEGKFMATIRDSSLIHELMTRMSRISWRVTQNDSTSTESFIWTLSERFYFISYQTELNAVLIL